MISFLRRLFKRESFTIPAPVQVKRPGQIKTSVQVKTVARPVDDRRLVTACLGNREKAERLVQFEVKRAPAISRADAVLRAIDRLERDRGR